MKHTLSLTIIALLATFGTAAIAQTQHDHTKQEAAPSASTASAPMADGEVRKIDKDGGKITLKHGEIKNLDMPPMTMVFNVKEKSLLEKIQVGDKVKFVAVSQDGKYVVTDLQVAK